MDGYPLTLDQLCGIMTHLPKTQAAQLLPQVKNCLKAAQCYTAKRTAHFLANLAHESGELRILIEQDDGRHFIQYDFRPKLGNDRPGDGPKFRGRGWIQLTGKKNFTLASAALGLDLVNNPDLAATVPVAALTAAWYWVTFGCNQLADADDFEGVVKAINGPGMNGLRQRKAYFLRAVTLLK